MKKQILIFAFLALAIFAGVNKSYGQGALPGSLPFIPAVPCMTDDALHPIAGKAYDYSAVVNPTGGNFLWWATKDVGFVTSQTVDNSSTKLLVGPGKDILAASGNYGLPGGATNSSTVNITWSSALLSLTSYKGVKAGTTPTFVVVKYNGTTCADNLKVWELDPKNGFTVDVRNIDDATKLPLGYTVSDTQCIDLVSKATYVGGNVEYKYGTNVLYYELIAANFSESWKPQITVTLPGAPQTQTMEYTYDKTLAAGWQPYVDGTTVFTTNETNTANGVSVYIRMTIVNNEFEDNATAHPLGADVLLALDGQNKEGLWDIKNSDCSDPAIADKDDTATQVLLPRPEVKEGTISGQATNKTMVPSPTTVP